MPEGTALHPCQSCTHGAESEHIRVRALCRLQNAGSVEPDDEMLLAEVRRKGTVFDHERPPFLAVLLSFNNMTHRFACCATHCDRSGEVVGRAGLKR